MKAAIGFELLLDDLAGYWTESALEILKRAGVQRISVEMELEAWRTLRTILYCELRWQGAFRVSTRVSLRRIMEQVLLQATLLLAVQFDPHSVSYAFESRLRRSAGARQTTATERRLYGEIVRQPGLRAAFKPPSRTDFTPRLQASARGG